MTTDPHPPLDVDPQHYDPDVLPIINALIKEATPNIIASRRPITTPNAVWTRIIKNMRQHTSIWLIDCDDELWMCNMCGRSSEVWDHCHTTGLIRGRLCQSCNAMEGKNPHRPEWQLWKWAAPDLQMCNNTRGVYNGRWQQPTQHEQLFYGPNAIDRMTLPLTELFTQIHDALEQRHHDN